MPNKPPNHQVRQLKHQVRQTKHQVRKTKHQVRQPKHQICQTKQVHQPNHQVRCFVARRFLLQIYALFWRTFTGLKIWWRTKNDNYQVWTVVLWCRNMRIICKTLFCRFIAPLADDYHVDHISVSWIYFFICAFCICICVFYICICAFLYLYLCFLVFVFASSKLFLYWLYWAMSITKH